MRPKFILDPEKIETSLITRIIVYEKVRYTFQNIGSNRSYTSSQNVDNDAHGKSRCRCFSQKADNVGKWNSAHTIQDDNQD